MSEAFGLTALEMDAFAENPEPRCACILLIATTGFVVPATIRQINEGLRQLREAILLDAKAARRIELAVVTFGPIQVAHEFATVAHFDPPLVEAGHDNPMGAAIETAVEMIRVRKSLFRTVGIQYFRPLIVLFASGRVTDACGNAASLVHQGEDSGEFGFFPLNLGSADQATLSQISHPKRAPARVGPGLPSVFPWLAATLVAASRPRPDDQPPFPNSTALAA